MTKIHNRPPTPAEPSRRPAENPADRGGPTPITSPVLEHLNEELYICGTRRIEG